MPFFLRGTGEGWIAAEYSLLPSATETRTQREAVRGKQSGRTQEIERLIGRSLRSVVDTKALGERTIMIDCDVIQADGGTRCASITGAFVAAHDCIAKLLERGLLATDPVRDFIAAVSVGIYRGEPVLDLFGARNVHRRRERVVGRLCFIDVVIGVDAFLAEFTATKLDSAIGDHLIGIHMGTGA